MTTKKNKTQIILNNDYYVTVDEYNYTLFKKVKKPKKHKKGTTYATVGYYPNLSSVLNVLKKHIIADSEQTYTVDSYIERLEKLENWCTKMKRENIGR